MLETVLYELLGEEVSPFDLEFIAKSGATEDSIRTVYRLLSDYGLSDKKIVSKAIILGKNPETVRRCYQVLQQIGLSDERIATQADLLGRNPEKIERNYQRLRSLGLSDEKIASRPSLLGMNPETIEGNYRKLRSLGLSDGKIASRAELLGMDPETIEENYRRLQGIGLSDQKIATNAQLLAMSSETVRRNYQHHVTRLRDDYTDRDSGRKSVLSLGNLLGIPPRTIEANVQYLYSLGLEKHPESRKAYLCGTRPQTKRKKIAWMLRELFDYRE